MNIIDEILYDKDVQYYKKKYREMFDKNPPPWHFETFKGLEDYKEHLRQLITEKKPSE